MSESNTDLVEPPSQESETVNLELIKEFAAEEADIESEIIFLLSSKIERAYAEGITLARIENDLFENVRSVNLRRINYYSAKIDEAINKIIPEYTKKLDQYKSHTYHKPHSRLHAQHKTNQEHFRSIIKSYEDLVVVYFQMISRIEDRLMTYNKAIFDDYTESLINKARIRACKRLIDHYKASNAIKDEEKLRLMQAELNLLSVDRLA